MPPIKLSKEEIVLLTKAYKEVFEFIAKPENLPLWTSAFSKADNKLANMVTPNGQLRIKLKTIVSKESGTVDWVMTMPDSTIGKALSRITRNRDEAIYTFVLLAPPVHLEKLEEVLSAQKLLLSQELEELKKILETK